MKSIPPAIMAALAMASALASPLSAQNKSPDFIVDHRASDENVSSASLDRARSLNVYFGHNSVGNNILLAVLSLSNSQPDRYHVQIAHFANPAWFADHRGIVDYQVGQNGDPDRKIADFAQHMNALNGRGINVAMMKLCFVDINPQTDVSSIWDNYRQTMESLERKYPSTFFVWCTCPLVCNQTNQRREEFNSYVRAYCRQNKQVLFDIADIESHDSQGKETRNQFGPCLCSDYSQDGGHPNSQEGMQRFAHAWWALMSRIAG